MAFKFTEDKIKKASFSEKYWCLRLGTRCPLKSLCLWWCYSLPIVVAFDLCVFSAQNVSEAVRGQHIAFRTQKYLVITGTHMYTKNFIILTTNIVESAVAVRFRPARYRVDLHRLSLLNTPHTPHDRRISAIYTNTAQGRIGTAYREQDSP